MSFLSDGIDKIMGSLTGKEEASPSVSGEAGRFRAFINMLQKLKPGVDLSGCLPDLFREFLSIVPAQSIALLTLDRNQNKLVPVIMVGENADAITSCSYDDENLPGKIMKAGETFVGNAEEIKSKPSFLTDIMESMKFSTVIITPYGVKEKSGAELEKGILCMFGLPNTASFDEPAIKLFNAFAGIVSVIRENHAMIEKLTFQNRELDRRDFDLYTVYQVSKTLSSILDVEELTLLLADMLTEIITVDHTLIFIMDEEETSLRVMAYKYLDPAKSCPGVQINASEKLGEWLMTQASEGKIIRSFNGHRFIRAFPNAEQVLRQQDIELIIPMIHKFKLVGFLALGKKYIDEDFKQRDFSFLSTIAPLAANAVSNAHLYEMAILDGLTRVFLGRYFQQRCKEEIKRAKRYNKVLSLVMWDIDHFKQVNDNFGHLTGDLVLKEITGIFKKSYRQGIDLIGRYGGEEFVMLLPDTPLEGAVIMCERLRRKVEKYAFCEGKINLTISGGISVYPDNGATYDKLIERADIELYNAKKAGRNKICYAGELKNFKFEM